MHIWNTGLFCCMCFGVVDGYCCWWFILFYHLLSTQPRYDSMHWSNPIAFTLFIVEVLLFEMILCMGYTGYFSNCWIKRIQLCELSSLETGTENSKRKLMRKNTNSSPWLNQTKVLSGFLHKNTRYREKPCRPMVFG